IEYMCNTGVDKGIARETDGVSCTSCIFYAKDSSECTILSKPIENYNEPPCGGRYYIRRY
ncbi:MAG: hypothetical protein F7B18_05605, partial [Desulfurococcales archaeon]|nr:hypothetical protein [Desulfurococcales archaeon]